MGTLHGRDAVEGVGGGEVAGFELGGLVRGRVEGETIRELGRGAEGDYFDFECFGVPGADVDGGDEAFADFISLCMYVIVSALGLGLVYTYYICMGGGEEWDHGVVRLLPAGLDAVLVEQRLRELSSPRLAANDFLHCGRFLFFGGGSGGNGFAFCGGRRTRGWWWWWWGCGFLALVGTRLESGFLGRHFWE